MDLRHQPRQGRRGRRASTLTTAFHLLRTGHADHNLGANAFTQRTPERESRSSIRSLRALGNESAKKDA